MDATSPLSERGTGVLCDRSPRTRSAPRSGPAIGFCPTCATEPGIVPVESLLHLSAGAYDRLPFGFVTVNPDGAILHDLDAA